MDAGDILQKLMEEKGPMVLTQELLAAVDSAFPDKQKNDGGGAAGNVKPG